MKKILYTLLLLFVTTVSMAQKTNHFEFGLGTGIGVTNIPTIPNSVSVQLLAMYNVHRVVIGYSQQVCPGQNAPAMFQTFAGVRIGWRTILMPYVGYSYGLVSTDVPKSLGGKERDRVLGLQLNIPLRVEGDLSSHVYFDVQQCNNFLFLTVGLKGSIGNRQKF